MRSVWCLDIDKTLADYSHREHLLRSFCIGCGADSSGYCTYCGNDATITPPKSWQAFTEPSILINDGAIKEAQIVVKQLIKFGCDIHFITGRQDRARAITQEWLIKHFGFDADKNRLMMREVDGYDNPGLHVPASTHKVRSFKRLLEIVGYSGRESFHFVDDDLHALAAYSQFGLTYHAPTCWASMVPPAPSSKELLFVK